MVTRQFSGITPEKWEDLKQIFASKGIHIDALEGEGETHGIKYNWLLAANQVLTLSISIPSVSWLLKAAGIHGEDDAMNQFTNWIATVR
jgi:succinylglutamate desuccinylase